MDKMGSNSKKLKLNNKNSESLTSTKTKQMFKKSTAFSNTSSSKGNKLCFSKTQHFKANNRSFVNES